MELDYCAPRGIPLSEFRSWPDDDRDHALAWLLDDRSKLACGCYPDETVGPEHFDAFEVEMVVCERHRAIGERNQRWYDNANEADVRHGILWTTRRDGQTP